MKKKFLLLTGIITMLCLFLCSCGEYKKVEEQIASLGNITIESGGALEKIAVAYSNLSEDEKQKVSNYRDYQDSLAEFNVENMINSIDQVTLDSGALLEEITTAY